MFHMPSPMYLVCCQLDRERLAKAAHSRASFCSLERLLAAHLLFCAVSARFEFCLLEVPKIKRN